MKTSFALSALRRLRGGKQGFSLVEVTIALGVTAFALVALFGMLPTGLNLFRASMDTSTKSQIMQQIASEYLQADFDTLTNSDALQQFYYFDDDGKKLKEEERDKSIYTAKVNVLPNPPLPREDSGDGLGANPTLVRVDIKIVRNPNHAVDPFSNTNNRAFVVDSYSTFVAKNK